MWQGTRSLVEMTAVVAEGVDLSVVEGLLGCSARFSSCGTVGVRGVLQCPTQGLVLEQRADEVDLLELLGGEAEDGEAHVRHTSEDVDWSKSHDRVVQTVLETYGNHHSLAHQQTLFDCGAAVLEEQPEIAEIRVTAPNKHHFLYDLARFGIENAGEVFHADDRPYGLQELTVRRDDAPAPGLAFDPGQGW
jgi:uricase-like protein